MYINIFIYLYAQHPLDTTLLLSVNTVRSAARSTKSIELLSSAERALITIPNEIRDLLVGILLDDPHIVRRSSTDNSRLVYTQTAISHKEYFEFVYSLFIPFSISNYIPQSRIVRDNRTNKIYSDISFTTMQLPCFNIFKQMFYISKVKKVPNNPHELLTPKGLAFWIMDDDSNQGSGLHISVYAFTNKDLDKLMYTLQDKFNLKCYIHYNRD